MLALGELWEAVKWLRKSLQAERELGQANTTARLIFGWTAVRHGLTDLYEEVIASFRENEFERHLLLPNEKYTLNAIRALISEERDDLEAARAFAAAALEEADKKHSGLRYHPTVGLVGETDPAIQSRLLRLARPTQIQ